ncbi:phosphoglycerate kinase [Enterobacteriaceae endosymbiont of Donacia bicoloricornis]|uniref:phosphoglycerate kinase n=1 Tax=Enterobacteriaceae endosymbiont of Donacia bicoloricornis TaxID=2675772 RepID=UPI0014492984|nr:phosphoglycerate kinase [Enterobacteriaceae endosymbiont of Donacia bicoloricornis]QJC37666.1 phosphoglycerate kinase [Enterobacteriaceae endosymbiont of Donacia bicoloricornis]
MLSIANLNIKNKILLIRSDFNVPLDKNGNITSDTRIRLSLPTIKYALEKKSRIILASHLGRPIEGKYNPFFSLKKIAIFLEKILNHKVVLKKNYLNGCNFKNNEIILLENVRFNLGEKNNNKKLSKKYASLCDIFVMDAFATAHRMHSSTYGVINFAKKSCAGFLLLNEIKNLNKFLNNPIKPIISIIGGSKISTKFNILKKLCELSEKVIVGGGIANTLLSLNNDIGSSLYEPNAVLLAQKISKKYKNIIIPIDCVVSTSINDESLIRNTNINNILKNEKILDIGNKTINSIKYELKKAGTILWNGPIGVFEFKKFRKGTEIIIKTIINSNAFSIVGGGDTLAAIELFSSFDRISYISTGGGSFLKYIEGNKLPVISILENIS